MKKYQEFSNSQLITKFVNPESLSLATTSSENVDWICDGCKHIATNGFAYILKKMTTALNQQKPVLCQKCSHAHRKGSKASRTFKISAVKLPPEVLIQETIKEYGYDPRKLGKWSRKPILLRCYITGEVRSASRCSINTSKSIIESGHYISVGGHTSKRRTGVRASESTLEIMRLAQTKRRERERLQKEAIGSELGFPVQGNRYEL